jgi:hypothetical protein
MVQPGRWKRIREESHEERLKVNDESKLLIIILTTYVELVFRMT